MALASTLGIHFTAALTPYPPTTLSHRDPPNSIALELQHLSWLSAHETSSGFQSSSLLHLNKQTPKQKILRKLQSTYHQPHSFQWLQHGGVILDLSKSLPAIAIGASCCFFRSRVTVCSPPEFSALPLADRCLHFCSVASASCPPSPSWPLQTLVRRLSPVWISSGLTATLASLRSPIRRETENHWGV